MEFDALGNATGGSPVDYSKFSTAWEKRIQNTNRVLSNTPIADINSGVITTPGLTPAGVFSDKTQSVATPASTKDVVFDKAEPIKAQERKNVSVAFPIGVDVNGTTNNGPHMVIKAYKYTRKLKLKENAVPVYTLTLPMPPMVSQGYGAHLSNFEGSFLMDAASDATAGNSIMGAALAAGAGIVGMSAIAGLRNRIQGGIDAMTRPNGGPSFMGNMAQQASWATEKGNPIRSQAESIAGAVVNPRYETTFNGMGLRRHQFRFTLVPVSQAEQDIVKTIVSQLRYSMHPSESVSDLVLSYPDKFIIEFRDAKGVIIDAIPYVPDSMLTEFDVDYTVGRMHGNDPVMTTISMAFSEQHTLTRKSDVI